MARKMIRFFEELKTEYRDKLTDDDGNDLPIAVEALIFTDEDKLLQCRRGKEAIDEIGKFEGIGGSIGNFSNLHEALIQRIQFELGDEVTVTIEELLEVRRLAFTERKGVSQTWVIVSYLCRLRKGEPQIMVPGLVDSLHYFTLEELFKIDANKLSPSTDWARKTYKSKYGSNLFF